MAQINVNNLTFHYEGSFDNIFENVSFSIDTVGKYSYKGTIDTAFEFDYFPYQITEAQMRLPATDFMEELKAGCEEWRVICELTQLGESAEILYRPYKTLSFGEQTNY